MNLPNKKYNIIYADPAWSYQGKMMNSSVTDHYSVMNINDICKLSVKDIADDNCILFMWVTLPKLKLLMLGVLNINQQLLYGVKKIKYQTVFF